LIEGETQDGIETLDASMALEPGQTEKQRSWHRITACGGFQRVRS
jgi:hypothetical protein